MLYRMQLNIPICINQIPRPKHDVILIEAIFNILFIPAVHKKQEHLHTKRNLISHFRSFLILVHISYDL